MRCQRIHRLTLLAFAVLLLSAIVEAWSLQRQHRNLLVSSSARPAVPRKSSLEAINNDNNKKKSGYQFGDITRAIGRRVTGNENYQVGDISKQLDKQAKAKVSELTGNKEYKFGDLSRYADSKIKEKIANYTGKETYQVGDISKEVLKRVWSGQYDLEDVVLALRVLLQMGATFLPIARMLPVKVLLEILNVGLAQDVGGKLMGGVAKALDERFKSAVTGDPKYQLGDVTKKQLSNALSQFTGKSEYSFGDISEALSSRMAEMETSSANEKPATDRETNVTAKALLDLSRNSDALAEWDRKFVESKTDAKELPKPK